MIGHGCSYVINVPVKSTVRFLSAQNLEQQIFGMLSIVSQPDHDVENYKENTDQIMVRSTLSYVMEQMTVSKRAINYYKQAMALFEELEEWEGLALCCLKIGKILFNQADYKGALKAYQRGHEAAQQAGAELIGANCLMNIGRIFEQRGEPEQAMYYYKTALTHFQQNLDTKGITQCVHNINGCAAKLKWLPVEQKECADV